MAHVCRHTWATNFRPARLRRPLDLKYQGGWSYLKMIGRYAHHRPACLPDEEGELT